MNLIGGEYLSEWFVAKITSVGTAGAPPDDGVPHGWTTMRPGDNFTKYYTDAYYPTITGSTTNMPAYSLDGSAAAVDDIVLMRYRARPNGMPVMEFISGKSIGSDCPKVSSVQCTSGMLVVTYQLGCEATTDPEELCPTTGPVGSILLWSKSTIPSGWLECNGTTYNTTTYPALFSVLGTNVLPDLKGRFVLSRNDPSLPLGTTGSITGGSGTPTLNNIALIYIIKAAN